ncbi:SKP1-like protein 11 [Dichanthelium oligosanthes]|uniref:SKP1-like protein 11 n=1 Tax=Dichanthelium oligosanthes TaxID=888268 RepID=A0A1E5UQ52_9POAL|nr:SKP1-like protein 11 [Dichanthelium oligosanthes]
MAPPGAAAAADKREGKRPAHPEEEPTPAAAADGETAGQEQPAAGVDEGDDLTLVADCGTEVRLSRAAARMSTAILHMMEDGCAEGRVPVRDVHASVLRLVVAYCEKHAPHYDPAASAARLRDPFPPFPIDFPPTNHAIRPVTDPGPDPHGLDAWDHKFIADLPDNSALFAVIIAANYLGIEDLLDLGCTAVADKMRGRTPEEIRIALDIENDYTPEQEAEVRRENAWAFED